MAYSRSLLFHLILEYSRIFQNVTKYSKVFKNIQKYSKIFENIWEYSGIIGKLFPSGTVRVSVCHGLEMVVDPKYHYDIFVGDMCNKRQAPK